MTLRYRVQSAEFTHVAIKGFLESGEFVQDAAKCPDVRLLVVLAALADLRRDVAWSPNHLEGGGEGGRE